MTDRVPTVLFSDDEDGGAIVYMCLTDFEYEVAGNSCGNMIYPSIEDLKRHRSCVKGCGIAEVRITGVRVVQEATEEDYEDEE